MCTERRGGRAVRGSRAGQPPVERWRLGAEISSRDRRPHPRAFRGTNDRGPAGQPCTPGVTVHMSCPVHRDRRCARSGAGSTAPAVGPERPPPLERRLWRRSALRDRRPHHSAPGPLVTVHTAGSPCTVLPVNVTADVHGAAREARRGPWVQGGRPRVERWRLGRRSAVRDRRPHHSRSSAPERRSPPTHAVPLNRPRTLRPGGARSAGEPPWFGGGSWPWEARMESMPKEQSPGKPTRGVLGGGEAGCGADGAHAGARSWAMSTARRASAEQLGYGVESVRLWVRQAETSTRVTKPGVSTRGRPGGASWSRRSGVAPGQIEILKRAASFFGRSSTASPAR